MLVDSHCHLDASEFDPDRGSVIERARNAGVTMQVVPAIACADWPALRELCAAHPGLYPAYGLHPMFLDRHQRSHLDELCEWLQRESVVAVGECGLDFHIEDPDPDAQRMYFRAQLELAQRFELPVILHARRALEEVIATIREFPGLRGVVHSFSGSEEQAAQLWKLGFHIGLGGPLTYERAKRLRRVVTAMPIEQLLLETDSPDQPLSSHRGRRNEPSRLPEVAAVVAQLRGTRIETVAATTTANARRLFGLPLPSAA